MNHNNFVLTRINNVSKLKCDWITPTIKTYHYIKRQGMELKQRPSTFQAPPDGFIGEKREVGAAAMPRTRHLSTLRYSR